MAPGHQAGAAAQKMPGLQQEAPSSPMEPPMDGRQHSLSFTSDMSGGQYEYDEGVEGQEAAVPDDEPFPLDLGYFYFTRDYHVTNARPTYSASKHLERWRSKDRTKTVAVALVLCLNIGVDAPDVVKTTPCAKLECWLDPFAAPPQKSLENIGKALQAQYERWQPRARYKQALDPTVEDVKKMCTMLRKSSKEERVLFHYNGHGVPKPTVNGEVWVFNKNFTQYIPLSIYDLQTWMGSPSIFVFDCSAAGNIVNSFIQFAEQREREYERMQASNPNSTNQLVQPMRDCILFAACRANETLPMSPDLPADLFTSCLTTPMEMAIRWFVLQNNLLSKYPIDIFDRIPGRLSDRRTPLGELSWIFTATTDTIAWDVLPRDLFQKLFRQDLLVAALARSFLLADRIMRSYNCTPISVPAMPPTHQHPLWQAWDLACDQCLSQLDRMANHNVEYIHSSFYSEHLTAFEVWLEQGSDRRRAPEQLPIVLQVLLSLAHRLRALKLLARFMDLGPWAVNLALSVGLFPYVVKLLQSPAADVRPVIVHIWTKILAVDSSCQADLVKDNGHKYFIHVLWNTNISSEERARAAYVLAVIAHDYRLGQQAVLKGGTLSHCLHQLNDPDPLLRQWLCLCMAETWANFSEAKWMAIREGATDKLKPLLTDPSPLVRAATVYALGRFIGGLERTEVVVDIENTIGINLVSVTQDASTIVRCELVIALSAIVHQNEAEFRIIAAQLWEEERRTSSKAAQIPKAVRPPVPASASGNSHVYQCLWRVLVNLSLDPFPAVAELAQAVVDSINSSFLAPSTPGAGADLRGSVSRRRGKGPADGRIPSTSTLAETLSRTSLSTIPSFRPSPLPLISQFFDWSSEQFAEPPERIEDEKPGGAVYEARLWRVQRNERVADLAAETYPAATTAKLEEQVAILENQSELVSLLRFHPYEPKLVVADERDGISVWNLDDAVRTSHFSNRNPLGTRITSLNMINEDDQAILMTGSDEGTVRFWRDYSTRKVDLLTSWRALTDLVPSEKGTGLVLDWQQSTGTLLASGDVRVIRVWDADKELCERDMPTFSDVSVSCLTSEPAMGNLIIAGCGDGAVRLYDRRVSPRECMVMAMMEHRAYVIGAYYNRNSLGELITGSVAGDVKIWDLRMPQSVRTYDAQASRDHPTTALAVHNRAPLFASGSKNGAIKVFNAEGVQLSHIRYHEGFLGQRIGPVASMAFHPHKVLLATGSTDGIISIFASDAR